MATSNPWTKLLQKQLKSLAFLLGLPTSGTKTEVRGILSRRVKEPPAPSEFRKILSVDMGIRNLGVCVLEAPHLSISSKPVPENRPPQPLTVSAWEKVNVLPLLPLKTAPAFSDSSSARTELKELTRIRQRTAHSETSTTASPTALVHGDFTPQNLASAAYTLISSLLLQHRPSAILIERQRFRSGGGFAVQEWTLRVNLLEHMMWAALETLRAQARVTSSPSSSSSDQEMVKDGNELTRATRGLQAVYEVSPAKVARFWCSGAEQALHGWDADGAWPGYDAGASASNVTKAQKVAVAQGWVDGWKAGGSETGKGDEGVVVEFEGDAVRTAGMFQSSAAGVRRKLGKKKDTGVGEEDDEEAIGKLDDLADCLLQGAAWVKWEENRRRLAEMVRETG